MLPTAGTLDHWDLENIQSEQRKHEHKDCHCASKPESKSIGKHIKKLLRKGICKSQEDKNEKRKHILQDTNHIMESTSKKVTLSFHVPKQHKVAKLASSNALNSKVKTKCLPGRQGRRVMDSELHKKVRSNDFAE
nr:hypothetical protein Iba_chr02bCG13130 [Ipomoea batatas]